MLQTVSRGQFANAMGAEVWVVTVEARAEEAMVAAVAGSDAGAIESGYVIESPAPCHAPPITRPSSRCSTAPTQLVPFSNSLIQTESWR